MKIVKVDKDENKETAQKYEVMSVPTLLFFKDGELVDQAVGFKPKEEILASPKNTCKQNGRLDTVTHRGGWNHGRS